MVSVMLCVQGFAQHGEEALSNRRTKKIATHAGPVVLDTLSIVPGTFSVTGMGEAGWTLDEVNAVVSWKATSLPDSVWVSYRVFPFKLNSVSRYLNYDSIRFNFTPEKPFVYTPGLSQQKIIDFGNINYNGSFGRGITVGNNQDAVVSSSLNLQLNGFIGDSIELTAAISDNNIPIQPEGNTQNINDFDRIFLQVKKGGWHADFGDIDIRQSRNYFLNFSKRLQGGSFGIDHQLTSHISNSLLVSGAITKGSFTRNVITAIEGNQGPYKLTGANNEIYFAVLAGTEKVFIDGQLMTRGQDQDYVIDYNTAELTFTVKHLITKDTRIQVEFQYTDRNYLNSLLYAHDELSVHKKLKIDIGVYSNADAKNSSINQTLTAQQKQFLSQIGNNIDSARYPNAVQDTFSVSSILYKKVDTSYNGITDTIYVYSHDKNDTLYNLSFTNVGPGQGNYTVVNDGNANGRVFRWVQPVNGQKQGDWDPVILLITPKKHQVLSAAARYDFNDKSSLQVEGAVSNYDINTFSTADKGDKGVAAKVNYTMEKQVSGNAQKGLALITNVGYEYVQDRFRPIEILRNVEFNRDWSLPYNVPAATEQLINASFQLKDEKNNFLKYSFTNYDRSDDYRGIRNAVENTMAIKGWHFTNAFLLTHVRTPDQKGFYLRPSVQVFHDLASLKNIRIGGSYASENNRQAYTLTDTLLPVSFAFHTWEAYIRSSAQAKNTWGLTYLSRENKFPDRKDLKAQDRSRSVNGMAELMRSEHHHLRLNATYRVLDVVDTLHSGQKSDKSLLGRAEYEVNALKGFLRGDVLYELGAGQEQKREYTYVEVPAGQGYYTWNDYNQDGIPQLNEFEVAVFDDQKKWIRVFTPTNEYVKANYIQFNYNVGLNPGRLIASNTTASFLKFIRRFSTSSALQINKKDISHGGFAFNPFSKTLADTSLITLYSFLSNTLFFNRESPDWGIDVTHRINNSKSLLNYGFESTSLKDISIKGRWNAGRSVATSLLNRYMSNGLENPSFANRNYLVKGFMLEPTVSYIYKSNFRVSLIYTYDNKKNKLGSAETAVNNQLAAEIKYNALSNGTVNGRFSFNHISYTGEANSTVGYLMLNGLLPGKNYLWNIELTRRLAGNLELNLQYEGRKPGTGPVVHTGRVSLRAIF